MPTQFMRALHLGHIQRPGGGGTSGGGGGPDMARRSRAKAEENRSRIGGFVQKPTPRRSAEDGGARRGAL